MIKFYKISQPNRLARIISGKISDGLDQGGVLWLIGGGSVIDVAVEAAKDLAGHKDLNKLTISLTDERFGEVGHADSNWQQLLDKGFLLAGARLKPVLQGENLANTVTSYSNLLKRELSNSIYSIALAGMSSDGHILGIKPSSPAVDSQQTVEGYDWQDYIRLTPTLNLIKQLDEIIIYAVGAEKHRQLDRIEQEVSARQQPAQLLKQAKRVSIYNDYKGERL